MTESEKLEQAARNEFVQPSSFNPDDWQVYLSAFKAGVSWKGKEIPEWFKPSKRPPQEHEELSFSISVLLYFQKSELYVEGWFDFEMDHWTSDFIDIEDMEFEWTFLPKYVKEL